MHQQNYTDFIWEWKRHYEMHMHEATDALGMFAT